MDEKRIVMIAVGAVLMIMTITLLAVTQSGDDYTGDGGDGGDKPDLNKTFPLLLISLDGFRSDYYYRNLPTLEMMASTGVKALYLLPSYPTVTFPNHYTIVTGLYPESHGIVNNEFYDPDFDDTFSMGKKNGKWWGGEPIWNTLTLQNKTSATFFWPGSDCNISGLYPTYYYDYDGGVPYSERIDKVLEWLSLPEEERPDFISLYFEEPDKSGHYYGPDSGELESKLQEMDGFLNDLYRGLRERKLETEVNIIVLSDHGMALSGIERSLNLTDYVPDLFSLTSHFFGGAFASLRLKNNSAGAVESVVKDLFCPPGTTSLRAYMPQDLPRRLHYSNNKRIGDIVLDMDSGYVAYDVAYDELYKGSHGYDNHLTYMQGLFIATGPDFKNNTILEPFQNIELYNLMCYLTGVEPAPNNGTEGSLYAALLNPPSLPDLPENDVPAAAFPETLNNITLHMADCPGDLSESEAPTSWLQELNITSEEQNRLEDTHLPWGKPTPLSGNLPNMLLLHHRDHITGYSGSLRMPLWTSFNVTRFTQTPMPPEVDWSSDVRLNDTNTPSCSAHANFTMAPLFPHVFSSVDSPPEITYLVTNALPFAAASLKAVEALADSWRRLSYPLNIVLGVAFDDDGNSLPDNLGSHAITDPPKLPSHFYVVATKCTEAVNTIAGCSEDALDSQAFIIPQHQTNTEDCLTGMDLAAFHLSSVHDVELLTGLAFYPDLEAESRIKLILKIHTYPWTP